MILLNGQKHTPQQSARHILMGRIDGTLVAPNEHVDGYGEDMTECDVRLLNKVLVKERNRIAVKWKYDPVG